jgi:TatD DNase family protein
LPPFINLHAHRKPQSDEEFVIRNAYHFMDEEKVEALPYSVSAGIHPWQLKEDFSLQINHLAKLASCKNVIAIGECGLDRIKGPAIEIQIDALRAHIALANRVNKPMILHLVKSYSDILAFAHLMKTPWIVHGFKGNGLEAGNLLKKGARLSFGPRLLTDETMQALFTSIPLEFIYLETDTKRVLIDEMYQKTALLRNLEIDDLRTGIWLNFVRDFISHETR